MTLLERWLFPGFVVLITLAAIAGESCSSLPKPISEIPVADRLRIELAAIQVACQEYLALPVEKHEPELDAVCAGAP